MRTLYHYNLCGFCRIARFMLSEKKLDFACKYSTLWDIGDDILKLKVQTLPVLVDINGTLIHGESAIREYLEEVYTTQNLLGNDSTVRAECRRIADWFCFDFYHDVYYPIILEKILKLFAKNIDRTPAPTNIRKAMSKLGSHMEYLTWLAERRNWLGGQHFSVADIYAASFLSVLDYLGCVQWNKYEIVKEWYVRIKSRPSFRNILTDYMPQIPPSKDYSNLDF